MKSLVQIFNEILIDNLAPSYIVIKIHKDTIPTNITRILNEGIWKKSVIKGYSFRYDTPNFDHEQRHVHIARDKHINAKNKQVSWNEDGSRHDRQTFDKNFNGMQAAKLIAKKVLKLNNNTQLESIKHSYKKLLLENISYPSGVCFLEAIDAK